MSDYLTEEQQTERIRAFWREYGWSIILGVVLAISVTLGWQYYSRYRAQQSQTASNIYTQLVNAALLKNEPAAEQMINTLMKHYQHTPYASIAALWKAKLAAQKNDYTTAKAALNWTIHNSDMPALKSIAQIRLARIALEQNQPKRALTILNNVHNSAYKGFASQFKGDAYVALNQPEKAKTAYDNALKTLPNPTLIDPILGMKKANLPVTSQPTAKGSAQ